MDILSQTIDEVERLIPDDPEAASKLLRIFLFQESHSDEHGSYGDALGRLAERSTEYPAVAAIILRFLPAQGLIPESNQANHIARSVVTIVKGSLPELARFLGVNDALQTHENFAVLRGAHERICGLLSPLLIGETTVELFVSRRPSVVQALNHSAVRMYCGPFGLDRVRISIDQLFNIMRKINTSDQAALHEQIKNFRLFSDELSDLYSVKSNFFIRDYFLPLLHSANLAVEKIIFETRARFSAPITIRLTSERAIAKRYPLDSEREFPVLIPLRNSGPGTAVNLRAEITHDADEILFSAPVVNRGTVPPGDFSVSFDALIIKTTDRITAILTISWEEMGDPEQKSITEEINVLAQDHNVPWGQLQYAHPYSTAVAKGGDFVGRKEKVVSLANRLLRNPMEPFYVTGQRRVGKTSLVLAAADFAKSQSASIDYVYTLWGSVAYEDPRHFIRVLGNRIAHFIERNFPGYTFGQHDFNGSLAPVLEVAEQANKLNPTKKYVIIIDEFDDIHPELYVQGNLASTFFANLRAMATCDNICIILVGGENMPFIMERQGQALNKFVRFGLDYFSRADEWDDFKLLVRKPSEGNISWHDDAITEMFNAANGNPYFAKAICAKVFVDAVKQRDADVTVAEVQQAISSEVATFDTQSFAHLWQDGIFYSGAEREPYILQRRRVLVAIARTLRRRDPVTLEHIILNKHSPRLQPADISAVINDFVRREVLREVDGCYQFQLPVFGSWLRDVGISRLVSDALVEELADAAQADEDRSYVQSDEITALTKEWPTYRGRRIGTDEVRAWLEQVSLHKEQRLLFTLLKHLCIFSEVKIREMLELAHSFIRGKLPTFVIRNRADRRTDVIVTYVEGEGKSGQFYASRYAEQNRIQVRSILSPHKFSSSFRAYVSKYQSVAAVILVDDIIATGDFSAKKLNAFARENEDVLREMAVPLTVIALTGTADGDSHVRRVMSEFDWLDFDLRICEPLTARAFAFDPSNRIWDTQDDLERAKALCRDLGANIYRDSPLGYGNQGLLIVFPETCPNNTLPIIHSSAKVGAPRKWSPLFPRVTN